MEAHYRNPAPTVDIIIEIEDAATGALRGIVLIERENPPHGWAIPGGFVDYGESVEHAAEREALEETSLRVRLVRQFHVYSDPARDPRQHTISTVFVARAQGEPAGADDALTARIFAIDALPAPLVFDHAQILADYREGRY
ncbi:MAG TPA: NUDIX hydrolase [Spirochaetota bacterium]|nr:NUDIX hydrolase [Spirochaetota bacterium]